ncbi:hypothetical protein C4E44_12460, partial [Pseudomonas sp. MWU12-2312b]
VGASLLAMVVNDNADNLTPMCALKFIVGTPPGASSLLRKRVHPIHRSSGTSPQGRRRQWNNKNNHCEGYRYVRTRSAPGKLAQRAYQPGHPESHLRLVARNGLRVV